MLLLYISAFVVLVVLLAFASIVDLRRRRLPDGITLTLIVFGLVLAGARNGVPGFFENSLAAAAGFGVFWAVREAYFRKAGMEGLGLGDAKLLAAAGSWLGPMFLAPVVLVAACLALVYVRVLAVNGTPISRKTELPFGPFLSIGFAVCWGVQAAAWV